MIKSSSGVARALFAIALFTLAGCDNPPAGEIQSPDSSQRARGRQPTATEAPRSQAPEDSGSGAALVRESWDLQRLGGQRIGHSQTIVEKVTEQGQELIRTTSLSQSELQRLGQTIQQKVKLTSWDRPSGELVRFETKISGAGGDAETTGRVKDGSLNITQVTAGKRTTQQIAWRPGWGGFFAPEESLRKQPLKPGEKRTLTALLPVIHQAGEIRMTAAEEKETLALPDGEQALLKIHVAMYLAGGEQPVLEADQWIDDAGETRRSLLAGLNQETLRVSKAQALARGEQGPVDVIVTTSVPLAKPIEDAHHTQRIVYRAHVKSGRIDGVFASCLSQQVKPIDDTTAEVTVIALRPETQLPEGAAIQPPSEADRTPNNLIQSDDATLVALAQEAAPGETDAWRIATALEKYVKSKVQSKNFSQAMATAAEVAKHLEGDCTEHAMLLAGLLRARQIPARVAIGLVYFPPQRGFAYHMWTEAWITDRWIPLDATLGLGGIGGGHLKLADSNLADSYASFLTVMQAMGRLELEVVSVEP